MNTTNHLVNGNIYSCDDLKGWTDWYHEYSRDSNTLVVTAGDSWTWGGILEPSKRLEQIYGHLVAKHFDADFINVGLLGGDNLSIIDAVEYVFDNLSKSYNKIYVVFTLTELGREFRNAFLSQEDSYNNLRGSKWPTFNEIIAGSADQEKLQFALAELKKSSRFLYRQLGLHLVVKDATSISTLFDKLDQFTISQAHNLAVKINNPAITWAVGKNYVNWINPVPYMINLEKPWTQLISEQGNLQPYPKDILGGTTKIALDPLTEFCKQAKFPNTTQQLTDLIETNLKAIDWFDQSPYNNSVKTSARHPLPQAHQWWADYICENIQ